MWCNPEDVLKDLSRFTGNRQRYLDRNYVVVGQNPPPPRYMEENDDELRLRFGYNAKDIHDNGVTTPDLHGIQEMLKLVNEHNVTDDDLVEPTINPGPNSVIVISKLNPNVREFIPKTVKASLKSENMAEPNDKDSNNKQTNNKNNADKHSVDDCNSKIDNNKNINDKSSSCNYKVSKSTNSNSGLSEIEFKNTAEALKTKISNAAKSDSYHLKREKNMAISSLLKLYTESPVITCSNVKLMTPDDFNSAKTENERRVISNSIEKRVISKSPETGEGAFDITSKKDFGVSIKEEPNVEENTKCIICVSPKPDTVNIKETIEVAPVNNFIQNDPEVKKSIVKVTDWLEPKKNENKKPALHLGPILYKRKEINKSPKTTPQNKVQKPDQCYKPSQYADDLIKMYTEKLKIREVNQNKATWDNLDEILKMKDEEVRKKKSENSSNSSSSTHINGSSEMI